MTSRQKENQSHISKKQENPSISHSIIPAKKEKLEENVHKAPNTPEKKLLDHSVVKTLVCDFSDTFTIP